MIERYTRPAMGAIWSLENRYRLWLEVELLALEGWAALGEVPQEAVQRIREKARFGEPPLTVEAIQAIEKVRHHDVIAFTEAVAQAVGDDARWFHYGLTSTDVVDTAQSLQIRQAGDLLIKGLEELLQALKDQIQRWKHQLTVGRTHGVHAEPTTFGFKLASFYAEMVRHRERLMRALREAAVVKLSGAVGTYADVPPQVEAYVAEKLGLEVETVATQVVARDRHAHLLATMAGLAGGLERLAMEIRHLQRTEVREVEEPFAQGQKGSSAMPHKKNPEKSERISGMARLMRGYALSALEDQALWHERDISHSSVERVILPDSFILLDYMLHLMATIMKGLKVYPEAMERNLEKTGGLIASPRLLLALVKAGLTREEAYRRVQEEALLAWEGGPSFKERVEAREDIRGLISDEEWERIFSWRDYVRHVDEVLARLGL
ncbi:MAG: adenylosuccinate lyase [Clostridiales bacterium]|nr:adenylosuccinate lyase [Clostridiales bacterium]